MKCCFHRFQLFTRATNFAGKQECSPTYHKARIASLAVENRGTLSLFPKKDHKQLR